MRLIAERLLPERYRNHTYVDKELVSHRLRPLPPPKDGHHYHLFCSTHNAGAPELMVEVAAERQMAIRLSSSLGARIVQPLSKAYASFSASVEELFATARRSRQPLAVPLASTSDLQQLAQCDHMLLYLNSQTWTRGEASAALAAEVAQAMDLGVHVLLAHEMPGTGGQTERYGCEFGRFFACDDGATPQELLQRGVYREVAVPLKGGPWREASMTLFGVALGLTKEQQSVTANQLGLLQDADGAVQLLASLGQSISTQTTRRASWWSEFSSKSGKRRSSDVSAREPRAPRLKSSVLAVAMARAAAAQPSSPNREAAGVQLDVAAGEGERAAEQGECEAEGRQSTPSTNVAASCAMGELGLVL